MLLAFTLHFTWNNCFLYTNPEFVRVSHLAIWFATQHYILNEFPYDVRSFIFPDFLVFLSFAFLIHFFFSLCPSTTINVTIQRTRLIYGLFSHSLRFGFMLKAAPLLGFFPLFPNLATVLVYNDYHHEVPLIGWLKEQELIFSQFWRLEVWDQSVIGLVSSEVCLLGLHTAIFSPCNCVHQFLLAESVYFWQMVWSLSCDNEFIILPL